MKKYIIIFIYSILLINVAQTSTLDIEDPGRSLIKSHVSSYKKELLALAKLGGPSYKQEYFGFTNVYESCVIDLEAYLSSHSSDGPIGIEEARRVTSEIFKKHTSAPAAAEF